MFKSSNLLAFSLIFATFIFVSGCSLDRADPGLMNIKFQNSLRADCSKLDLSQNEVNPSQIRALSRCLNSHGDLGTIDESLQNASDATLSLVSQWMNRELLNQPKRLSELEQIYNELVQRNILDNLFSTVGNLLKDPKIVDLIIQNLNSLNTDGLITSKNIQLLSKALAQLFSSPQLIDLKKSLGKISKTEHLDLFFKYQNFWAELFTSIFQATSICVESPLLELVLSTEEITPLFLDLKNEPKLRNHIFIISELMLNGKLKNILHTILKSFHTQTHTKIHFSATPKIEITGSETTTETGNPLDSKKTTELRNDFHEIFKVIKKNPNSVFAILDWVSHFDGIESNLSDWLISGSLNKKSYDFGTLSTLERIETLVMSADIDITFFPNPAINFMNDISQSWGGVPYDKQPDSIRRKFQNKNPPTLLETHREISEKISNYDKFLNSRPMSELAPKNIREKIRLGLTLLPVIEENIESTGLVTFRDLFLLLKDTKSSATDPLRIVTHLCHAGLLSGISLASETLSERNVFLEKIIFSLSQIVKKEKAKETVLWIARQKNQTRFFKIFNWISQDLNKSTRLGVNISNGLFIMGSSNSPQIYQLFSEMIEKLQTLNDQEIEAVLELLSHPVLNSVTTI